MSPEDRKMFAYKHVECAEEKPAAKLDRPVLLARPVQGEVDYDAMLLDIKKRHSETIAYLAK